MKPQYISIQKTERSILYKKQHAVGMLQTVHSSSPSHALVRALKRALQFESPNPKTEQ